LRDVLAGFIRFAHAATSIPRQLTDETVDAVDRWRPAFAEATQRPGRPAANALRLARTAAGVVVDDVALFADVGVPDEQLMAGMVEDLEAVVIELAGGRDAYEAVTDDPLDNVPFNWSAVPPELHDHTAAALAHLDRWSEELFDTEVRTIARAVLAGVVAADPAVFKRSPRRRVGRGNPGLPPRTANRAVRDRGEARTAVEGVHTEGPRRGDRGVGVVDQWSSPHDRQRGRTCADRLAQDAAFHTTTRDPANEAERGLVALKGTLNLPVRRPSYARRASSDAYPRWTTPLPSRSWPARA
jgi:hypothetical protein